MRKIVAAALGAFTGLGLALGGGASAQDYPTRTVRIVVPFAAGQATDMLARVVAERLSKRLGASFVVENTPGAGGRIAMAAVAKAAPDGYTLVMATIGPMAIAPALYTNLPYSALTSFAPIVNIALTPQVLVASRRANLETLSDFVTRAKASPGRLEFASAGHGSNQHLTMEMFRTAAGLDLVHVPYKGGSEAQTALLSGVTAVMFDAIPAVLSLVRSGELKGLGIASAQRSPFLPDLPTLAEQGFKDFESVGWIGLAAPAKTPDAILDKLNAEVRQLLADADLQKQLATLAFTPVGDTRESFRQFVRSENEKWVRVIRDAGIKPQ